MALLCNTSLSSSCWMSCVHSRWGNQRWWMSVRCEHLTGQGELSKGPYRSGMWAWVLWRFPLCFLSKELLNFSLVFSGLCKSLWEIQGWERHTTVILEMYTKRKLGIIYTNFLILWRRKLRYRQEIGVSSILQQGCILLANSKEEPIAVSLDLPFPLLV